MFLGVVACLLFFDVLSSQKILLSTTTPIYDGKNDNDERTNITKESEYPPSSVIIFPSNDTIYTKPNGKPAQDIMCKADCLPECTYAWYRENEYFTTGNNLFARESLDRTGSYRFRCHASNGIGSNSEMYSRWITVEVKDGPNNVTIKPSPSEKENDFLQLTCSASCYHECRVYRWYMYNNYNIRSEIRSTHILSFSSLSKTNRGKYQCEVTDDFGTNSANYTVNVQYSPKGVTIQYSSWYRHLIEGQDYITFTCNADCNPGCSYLYYQNGKLLNKRYINERVYRNMSGRYTCSAKNSIIDTYKNSSNSQDINIRYGPKTANVWRNYQTISGDIIEKEDTSMTIPLRCWSSCNPSCEVAWYKDGQLESRGNPVINITRDRRMSGVYQCEASGVEGKVRSAQEHVTIQCLITFLDFFRKLK
nr:hemicentin-1-like [Crassostrea gigas]